MDAQDVQAISEAKENIGDFIRLKHLRMNTEKKKEELTALEAKVQSCTKTQITQSFPFSNFSLTKNVMFMN